MATDVALLVERLLPGAKYGSAAGETANVQYANLARTWADSRALPTRATLEAVRAAADLDQALIDDDPSAEEILFALLDALPGNPAPIVALRNRRSAAEAARTRAGQPRGRSSQRSLS